MSYLLGGDPEWRGNNNRRIPRHGRSQLRVTDVRQADRSWMD